MSNIGTGPDGKPCNIVIEGRQRVRSLRYLNNERARENPPAPPMSINAIVRTFSSPRKAREVKIVTGQHVELTMPQKCDRAWELKDNGLADVDIAPLVGCVSVKHLKTVMNFRSQPEAVKAAVASGAVTANAVREMRHLSEGERTQRVATIASGGLRGKRARQVARTGAVSETQTKAPAASVVAGIVKRTVGSKDPIFCVIGAILTFATTGADNGGIDKVPSLRALVDEEIARYNGAALSAAEIDRLKAYVESNGGVPAAATKIGVNAQTIAKAMACLKVKPRVRAALLAAISPEPAKAA